jgi:glucose-6-phosphate isomerase
LSAASALFAACREPYFNEWTRAERGGRPRVYLLDDGPDNDQLYMLTKLVGGGRGGGWALVGVLPDESHEANAPLQALLRDGRPDLTCYITTDHRPAGAGEVLTCDEPWPGFASPFSTASLLAGSVMGIDVVRLLEGGAFMQRRFAEEPIEVNAALRLAAFSTSPARSLVFWSSALSGIGQWRRRLWQAASSNWEWESFPRVSSHAPTISVAIESWRCDSIILDEVSGSSIPELARRRVAEWLEAQRNAGAPVFSVTLPGSDEASLGQLFQLFLLAADAERRLVRP